MADHPMTPFDTPDDPEWRELDRRLRELAGQVHFPPTPDLAAHSRRLLSDGSGRFETPRTGSHIDWRSRLAVAALLLILLAAGAIGVSGPARQAVASWLDIPGLRLLIGGDEPPPAGSDAPLRDWLGRPVSLSSLAEQVPFPLLLPQTDRLGAPDAAYLLIDGDTGLPLVSLVYAPGADLPTIPGSDAGLLIMQFTAPPDSIWLNKQGDVGTDVGVVRVNGVEALWIGGAHRLALLPGSDATPGARTSANVLLWHRDGVTYRIEANLPQATMIEIAESMRLTSS